MKAHEAFQQLYKSVTPKQLTEATGLSVSTFHKWSEAGESHRMNPLETISAATHAAGDLVLVHWLCANAGGYFVKNPPVTTKKDMLLAAGHLTDGIAEFERNVAQAELQRPMPAAARQKLRAAWERLKSVAEGFVQSCERGTFRFMALFWMFGWWLATGDMPEPALAEM